MKPPATPAGEAERLAALAAYEILDTPPEPSFDALTTLAAELLGVPIALVSIIDAERQWFKSRYGLDAPETPRALSFCGHVVAAGAPLLVPDSLRDERFADNPLVTGEPRVHFYAGSPLRTPDGHVLGTLCAIDHHPRQLTPRQLHLLDLLAGQVVAQLELRRQNLRLLDERALTRRYRTFFELTPELFCTADETLHFRELNPAWEETLGWTLAELRARPFTDFIHPDDLDSTRAEAGRLMNEGVVTVGFENRYRHKDGRWIALSWVARVEQGFFFASARDVTAVRAGELALSITRARAKNNEVRLRELLETMAEGVVVQDADAIILDCNRAAEQILGLGREQILGRSSLDPDWRTLGADGKPFAADQHPAVLALRSGEPQNHVVMGLPRKGGDTVWISINARPLAEGDRDGVGSVVVTFRDITAERAAEQKAISAEERLRAIIDSAVDAIITIDEGGVIERANPAVERLFGYSPAELTGRHVSVLMPSPDREPHDGFLAHDRQTGERRVVASGREVVALRKDGSSFPAELAVSQFELQGERRFTGILRDISERKRVERLQAEFVSTVSHELRTPLTSIRGSLGLIAGGAAGELPPKAHGLVDIALRNSERLSRLVNDVLDIQKIEAGRMQFRFDRVDLLALARQALLASEAVASESRVGLLLESEGPMPPVIGDEDRLIQVLTNLLSNAIKFSPESGSVRLVIELAGSRVRLSVSDQGPGVPPEFADRIFGRFQQADNSDTRKRGGTGLGLNISKAIIERLGGSIGFASTPGQGCTFFFELPALDLLSEHSSPGRPIARVLVCEDDPDLAQLLRLMLHEAGMESAVAWSGAEAKRRLAEEPFDAMTLDLMLPDQDGLELLRELREDPKTSALPVVVITARAEEGRTGFDGANLEVVDWLDKPIDQERLLSALRCGLRAAGRETAILHVEDDVDTQLVVGRLLAGLGQVVSARDVAEARKRLGEQSFALVVLDLDLPDGSGVALLADIAELGASAPPVVIFSGREPSRGLANRVQEVLVKGHSSNAEIVRTVTRLIGRSAIGGGSDETAPRASSS